MITEFFTVSGYAFWVILAIITFIDIGFLTVDDGDTPTGWAVFFTVAGFLGAVLFSDAFVGVKIATLVAGAAVYLVLGVCWSFKKWYDFVIAKKKDRSKDQKPPLAASHKQQITTWMMLWPFSFSWWVLTWPRHAFVWMYERLSTIFDRISARIWAT
jgi:hypothetical protein